MYKEYLMKLLSYALLFFLGISTASILVPCQYAGDEYNCNKHYARSSDRAKERKLAVARALLRDAKQKSLSPTIEVVEDSDTEEMRNQTPYKIDTSSPDIPQRYFESKK
jgi:hypothetical protein